MRTALLIAGRILRQRLRDRSAIIFAVITPLGLAIAFAAVIPDFSPNFHTTLAVVDQDGGELATLLTDEVLGHLEENDIADISAVATEAAARRAVEDGDAGAGIVIPAGFTADIRAGVATEVRILGGPSPTAREIARASVSRFAQDVGAVQLMVGTYGATGGVADEATMQRALQAVAAAGPIAVTDGDAERAQASLATFYGAAMAIMFVFFATQYGALAVLGERQGGTLQRLLAAPIARSSIILGGALAGLALGLIAMSVLVVATTLISGADWGPPPLVALLLVAAVVAAMGISALIATVARTTEQAGSLTAIVALSMSAVGGVFIPLSQAPELLSRLALVTPHAWFLRAIDTLSLEAAGLADILPSVAVLVAMGLVTGVIGLARAGRSLVPA